ncbi:MAG: uroporphyrinogen-III C-methyltransferase [Robiginitomaculum sp.]|nr:MAG: uroporphyrinogen-III C-methyltransferase [Robiginitomaculum sp.]
MRYLPIHVDLKEAKILIVGGGRAAEAKMRTLVNTQAALIVVAMDISDEIQKWVSADKCVWKQRAYKKSDISGVRLVYLASEDIALDSRVAEHAHAQNILVNRADDKQASDFFSPAIIDRSPVTISIGTEGTSPALARALKQDIESRLPNNLGKFALMLAKSRKRLMGILPSFAARQHFWATLFNGSDLTTKLSWDEAMVESKVSAQLAGLDSSSGHVALVGAGPGDPDLMTHQARHKLFSADVIVYDRLVSKDVLGFGRKEAEYIYVGKNPNGRTTPQEEINKILVAKAKKGLSVVRLKGGDPLIFGRADEEVDVLVAAGISFEICPGITSAAAAAAAIGVSLTARGQNKAVSLITGHDTKGFAEQDWTGLARPDARAAIYMGIGAARFIQGRLLVHGASAQLPVSVVENASCPEQKIVSSRLGTLADDLETQGIKGPAILMIGYAVRDVKKLQLVKTITKTGR